MTRKDYIDYAERLRAREDQFIDPTDYRIAVKIAAEFFAADNPRFDHDRFVAATRSDA